jgi:23S rRNA (guanine745-N1)-methyltransferase
LPYAKGSFDVLLSVTSRLQPAEFRRVLVSAGTFVLAVPGADDLVELRAVAKGEGVLQPRIDGALAGCAADFEVVAQRTLRWQLDLDRAGLEDLLASSYRGARRAERVRLEGVEGATVTMSRDLALLRSRP